MVKLANSLLIVEESRLNKKELVFAIMNMPISTISASLSLGYTLMQQIVLIL